MKSCKLCWALSAFLVIAIAGMGYMFVIRGNVTQSEDGRTAIILNTSERDLVLGEMRAFLETIQSITQAIVDNDMKAAATSAKTMGMASAGGVPVALMAKLPLDFKQRGMATHKAFDDLAAEATDMGDGKIVLAKLAKLMQNCTGCHAGYRLESNLKKGN